MREQSVEEVTVPCGNYQSVTRTAEIKENSTHLVAIHRKFLHHDADTDTHYLLTVDDNQRVEKKVLDTIEQDSTRPNIIKLPQNQILLEKWRIFVIGNDIAPGSLVTLEAKPTPLHKKQKTIEIYPFSPEELKNCFEEIRMETCCYCLPFDQWSNTGWGDVLNMWLTELESLRRKPTSYCKETGRIKTIIYMALAFYARQKNLFGDKPDDAKQSQWDRIDEIYQCIFKTLHNVIQYYDMEVDILNIIANRPIVNENFIEQHLPLKFHFYAPSITSNINTHLSEKHHANYPPFLTRALETMDTSLLFEDTKKHETTVYNPLETKETSV